MNERSNDRFESLISAAVVDCVYQTADEFCAVDTSAVPSTPRLYKKVMRNLPGRKRTTVKVILVAALVAAFVALTACACITEIREYVWGVVTEWYGEYFEVSFEPEPVTTEEPETYAPEAELPTTIEQIAKLSYLPDGCDKNSEYICADQYFAEYDWGNGRTFIFGQCTYDMTNSFVDGEDVDSIYIQINNCKAVLTEKIAEGSIKYCLFWQDGRYRYYLRGDFSSVSELIEIAENVSFE